MSFRRFLSRHRLLAFLGVAALLFGLAMLHPYPRQSLFGPKIHGKTRWELETEIREAATRDRREAKRGAFEKKLRQWLNLTKAPMLHPYFFRCEDMFPLALELADDPDEDVRRVAEWALLYHDEMYQEPALPFFREQLKNEDPSNRIYAARAIWHITKDRNVVPVLKEIIHASKDDRIPGMPIKSYLRAYALEEYAVIARDVPELFSDVASFAHHSEESMRAAGIYAIRHFGGKGLPIIIQGLDDRSEMVRQSAASALRSMGKDARPAVPALKRLLADPDTNVRSAAIEALFAIDRIEFEHLKYPPDPGLN